MQHAGGTERGAAVLGGHCTLCGVCLSHAGLRRAADGAGGVPPQLRMVLLGGGCGLGFAAESGQGGGSPVSVPRLLPADPTETGDYLSLIHISEPTRR